MPTEPRPDRPDRPEAAARPAEPAEAAARSLRHGFARYTLNTGWLLLEKVLRLGLGFGTNVLVARHLGAQGFGLLSYAFSLVALLQALASLGMTEVVTKRLVERPGDEGRILGTAALARSAGGAAVLAALGALLWLRPGGDALPVLVVAALCLPVLGLDTVTYLFQARVQSREAVVVEIGGLVLLATGRLAGIALGAGVAWFAGLFAVEAALLGAGYAWRYRRTGGRLRTWRFDGAELRGMLGEGFILMLSGFVVSLYMRVDQVMIRGLLGDVANGWYAVAVNVSELWLVVPRIVAASVFPAIVNARGDPERYRARLQGLMDFMTGTSLLVIVPVALAARPLVRLLYGEAFLPAAAPLAIHAWGGLFAALSFAAGKWFIAERRLRAFLVNMTVGLLLNVALNAALLPRLGIPGAALATVASYAVAMYLMLALNRDTRPLFRMTTASFHLPRSAASALRALHALVSRG